MEYEIGIDCGQTDTCATNKCKRCNYFFYKPYKKDAGICKYKLYIGKQDVVAYRNDMSCENFILNKRYP